LKNSDAIKGIKITLRNVVTAIINDTIFATPFRKINELDFRFQRQYNIHTVPFTTINLFSIVA